MGDAPSDKGRATSRRRPGQKGIYGPATPPAGESQFLARARLAECEACAAQLLDTSGPEKDSHGQRGLV